MSSLAAAASVSPLHQATRLLDNVTRTAMSGTRLFCERFDDRQGRWALSRLELQERPAAASEPDSAIRSLVHGRFSNPEELARLAGGGSLSDPDALVSESYRRGGLTWLRAARGAFSLAIVDNDNARLIVANDVLGTYPVYWHHRPGWLVVGPSVRSLTADSTVSKQLDPRAVADYLTFGFVLGDKTLAADVTLLSPGTVLIYHWNDDRLEFETYASVTAAFARRFDDKGEYLTEVSRAFSWAVGRASEGSDATCLSLSGGLDSRAILSAMNGTARNTSTYTVGVKSCADEVISEKLARISGTHHRFIELDQRYLGDFVETFTRMVSLSDGLYLSHGLTEALVLSYLEGAGCSTLIRGHGGELAKMSLAWPLHTDDRIRSMADRAPFADYMLNRVNYVTRISLAELFQGSWFEAVDGQARASLERSLEHVDLSPVELCSYLYLMEHHRRFTVASLEPMRRLVNIGLPFVDQEFLQVLLAGRPEWRDSTEIHRFITHAHQPALLAVRNSNTGAPGNAGPIVEAIAEKVNVVLRRLNVPGYRHYHNFERWMTSQLVTTVEAAVLSADSIGRGMLRPEAIRRLIDETRAGSTDHVHLLQILLILELWQRES